MPPPKGVEIGYALKTMAIDGATKVFINICGHPSVGLPLTRSMDPIPSPEYLDVHGVDNLVIPISVGDPDFFNASDAHAQKMVIIDVVVHVELTRRAAAGTNPRRDDLVSKLSTLAVQWVQQEAGLQIDKRTIKRLENVKYKERPKRPQPRVGEPLDPKEAQQLEERIMRRTEDLYQNLLKESESMAHLSAVPPTEQGAGLCLPSELKVNTASNPPLGSKRAPMIVELGNSEKKTPLIKKGFLNNAKTHLYGEEGTPEGVLPEGAGDPLGHIPKSLREKCKIIDTCIGAEAKPVPAPPEISGEEFLSQLSAVDAAMRGTDPNDARKMMRAMMNEANSLREKESRPVCPTSVAVQHVENGATVENDEPLVAPSEASGWSAASVQEGSTLVIRLSCPPEVVRIADIDLNIDETRIDVDNGAFVYTLPVHIVVDSAKAKYVKATRTLIVTCGVCPTK
jgi:hypothetical protein